MVFRRRKLSENQRRKIKRATYDVLDDLIRFHLTYDVTNYLLSEAGEHWKETEDRLHAVGSMDYSITGTGVIAYRAKLRNHEHKPFVIDDEPIDPAEAIEALGDFPLDAAGVAYIFTLLELYGNFIVSVVNKKFFVGKGPFTSWHHKIWSDANISKPEVRRKMAAGFAEPFNRQPEEISMLAVTKIIALKDARNSFAHEGKQESRFDTLFSFTIDLICEIYYMLMPDDQVLVAYPFTEHSGRFEDAREFKRMLDTDEW